MIKDLTSVLAVLSLERYLTSGRQGTVCEWLCMPCKGVLVAYCFCNKLSQTQGLKTMSKMGFMGLKFKQWQNCISSRGFGGKSIP